MKCCALDKNFKLCGSPTSFIFCKEHRIFWWLTIVVIATLGGLYQDVLKPFGSNITNYVLKEKSSTKSKTTTIGVKSYGKPNSKSRTYQKRTFDHDKDGIDDKIDNCVGVYNPEQVDMDGDGVGDDCDNSTEPCHLKLNDLDNDGICDEVDNCLEISNPDQSDFDCDGIGDLCDEDKKIAIPCQNNDTDFDDDGVCDSKDNCIGVFNPSQKDSDCDGHGDACDN